MDVLALLFCDERSSCRERRRDDVVLKCVVAFALLFVFFAYGVVAAGVSVFFACVSYGLRHQAANQAEHLRAEIAEHSLAQCCSREEGRASALLLIERSRCELAVSARRSTIIRERLAADLGLPNFTLAPRFLPIPRRFCARG